MPDHRDMAPLKDRPTPELIMIFLTGVIGMVAFFSCVIVVVSVFFRPDADLSKLTNALGGIMTSLISALIGYVAGKSAKGPQ